MGDGQIFSRIVGYIQFDLLHFDLVVLDIYLKFISEKLKSYIYSEPDLSSESLYWRRFFRKKAIESSDLNILTYRKEPKPSLMTAMKVLKNEFNETIICLDIGCGPISEFYTKDFAENDEIKIITIDPLADVYQELHKKYSTGYNLTCIKGYGEKLKEMFPNNMLHCVYIQNALDHSQDPVEFLQNTYHILKPGGVLILDGFIKEGTAAHWLGLHNWDIETEKDDLLLTNRSKSIYRKNMTQPLGLKIISNSVDGNDVGGKYTMIYQK
ncbi:MAG: class I SAM-dependent methyltransferase [Methanomethylovorans sp.]|uniref:class I SAM-dependent methyltransferase n=1 Tax=Methanomethylovorans sp. TaxID=2758717 RepID=UPI003530A572